MWGRAMGSVQPPEHTHILATWQGRPVQARRNHQGRITLIKCPQCGGYASIIDSHEVAESDGKVTIKPSLVCPYGCGWHVTITDGVCRG